MRRAITPAICLTPTRALSASRATVQRSFSSDASSRYAATKPPRAYATSRTRPATGERFTCTSRGDRKMDTRTARPTQPSSTSATPITRPSAGASTAPVTAGGVRSGSRKKPRHASAKSVRGVAAHHHPIQPRIHAPATAGAIKRQPSEAMGMRTRRPALDPRRLDPGHHLAQPRAHLLDRMLGIAAALGEEARTVGLVLQHPFARELSRLDLREDLLHLGLRLVADDPRPPRVVAVLRGVRDRVAHVGETALVEEIHDQLHLVHALE